MAGVKSTVKSCLLLAAITCWRSVLCDYEEEFDLLIPPRGCESSECPLQKNKKLRQQLCSFSCPDGLRYICLENGEEEQVLEFCAPNGMECKPGYKGSFSVHPNNRSKVIMKMEMCPNGTYQPHTSGCIHACKQKLEISKLQEGFKVKSLGDNVRPPTVYCDYTSGYRNRFNLTFMKFDDQFKYEFQNLCTNESNPCAKGLTVLPNGSCVLPCGKDEARDVSDFFICKHGTGTNSPNGQTVDVIIQTTIGLKIITERKQDNIAGNSNHSNSEAWIIAFSVLAVVLFVIMPVIIMVCYCAWNKRKNKQMDKTPNGNIEEPNSSQDIELKALDESDKEPDDLKETESLLEKAQELPQENGIQQHTVEINSEEKSPKPKRKEHDSKSRKKESVKNLKHIESIENNYSANTQHFHFYNDQTQPNAANAWKEVENGTGGLAGELKKKQDDTLTPTQWNALNTQPQSVGCLIAYGDNRGTVFRVGTCYAMTAFHIFSDIVRIGDGPNEEDQFDWLLLKNDEIYVNFNESITDKPRILSKLTCIFYDRNLDVAVLKFDLISDLPRKMVLDKSGFSNPKAVNIIGFGHPSNTSKKKIDPSCSVIPAASVKIRQAHAWLQTNRIFYRQKVDDPNVVDAGYYGYDDPHKIILNCYLEHGASGAPLLAVDNKRCVVVVGILTNGIPDFYFLLSPADQRAFPTAYRFEYGTRMKDIYHAIQEANPELAKDIFGEQ